MDAQFASPPSALQLAASDSRSHSRPPGPYRETTAFGDMLQASRITGRLDASHSGRPALAETSLRINDLARAEDRTPIAAKKRAFREPESYRAEHPREERPGDPITDHEVNPAAATHDPFAAADMRSRLEADENLAPAAGSDAEDEACSACETETTVLSFSRCIPLNAAGLTVARQLDTNGQPGVAPASGGLATAVTPTTPTETISLDDNSAQTRVHPAGEGASTPPSLLVQQAVAEGAHAIGVNAAQTPAGDTASSQTSASLTQASGDAAQPSPTAVAPANTLSDAKANDEIAAPAAATGVDDEARSAYETETAVLSFSLRARMDAAKPAYPIQPEMRSEAGVDPVPNGQAAAVTRAESASIDGNSTQAKVHSMAEGVSSRPSSLLVPQAVLLDGGDGASGNAAPTPADATGPGAPGSDASIPQPGHGVVQATKPTDAPSPQPPASLTRVPGDVAQPSPIAVAAAPDTDAGGDDLAQNGHGFPAASGGHAIDARASGTDGPLAAKPVAAQLGVHIGKAVKAGLTRIEIELEPASLGKVEVRLDFGRDGRISAMFVAETREALDALRADARTLERALSEAGVKTDSASLDFSLREHGAGSGGFADRYAGVGGRPVTADAGDSEAEVTSSPDAPKPRSGDHRLDIHA